MGALRTSAILALMITSVFAVQNPNITTNTYDTIFGIHVKVAPEPRGRGTYAILFSCTATFIFCIWTAVHPNIIANTIPFYRIFYKLILALISGVVPEGVLIGAFGQWREASQLHKACCEEWGISNTNGSPKKQFTMEVAFFVVMGGFTVRMDTPVATPPDPECGHFTCMSTRPGPLTATLTPKGFLHFFDRIIQDENIDFRDISDKGKASSIAKVLAGGQALWLLTQCISRLAINLPLTLLEVHVSIQVVCAVIVYLCWWNKPLDVNEPIKITLPPCAISVPGERSTPTLDPPALETPVQDIHVIVKQPPPNLIAITAKACYDTIRYIEMNTNIADKKPPPEWVGMLAEAVMVSIIGALHAAAWNIHFPTNLECFLWRLSSGGMCVFPLAVVFIAFFTGYQKDLIRVIWGAHLDRRCIFCFIRYAVKEAVNVGVQYGKLGAWRREERHGIARLVATMWHSLLVLCCFGFLGAYALCIGFITVESYISIRDPPEKSFWTPVWSDYWPHL